MVSNGGGGAIKAAFSAAKGSQNRTGMTNVLVHELADTEYSAEDAVADEIQSLIISPRAADYHSSTEQAEEEEDDDDNLEELIFIDDAEQEQREL